MSNIERATFFDSSSAATDRRRQRSGQVPDGRRFHAALVDRAHHARNDHPDEQQRRRRDKDEVARLMARANTLSKELQQRLTWSAVVAYRETIGEILRAAQGEMVAMERVVSRHNIEQRKQFVLIKKINGKMEEMVTQFLRREQAQLQVLELVGEINGLLFDLQF